MLLNKWIESVAAVSAPATEDLTPIQHQELNELINEFQDVIIRLSSWTDHLPNPEKGTKRTYTFRYLIQCLNYWATPNYTNFSPILGPI